MEELLVYTHHQKEIILNKKNTHGFSTKWPVFVEKLDRSFPFSTKCCIFMDKAIKKLRGISYSVMLNEVKHLYNKDSSLMFRLTVSVIIYIVTIF